MKKTLLICLTVIILMFTLSSCVNEDVVMIKGKYELVSLDKATEETVHEISVSNFSYFEMTVDDKKIVIDYKLSEGFYNTLTDEQRIEIHQENSLEGKFVFLAKDNTITIAKGELKGVYNYKRGIISGRVNVFNVPCDMTMVVISK